MKKETSWEWEWLIYTATVLLNRSLEDFWLMTPHQLNLLFSCWKEIQQAGSQNKSVQKTNAFIDDIF